MTPNARLRDGTPVHVPRPRPLWPSGTLSRRPLLLSPAEPYFRVLGHGVAWVGVIHADGKMRPARPEEVTAA